MKRLLIACLFLGLLTSSLSTMAIAAGEGDVDMVVVCHERLRSELRPWRQLRQSEGLRVAFCDPDRDAMKQLSRIREIADESTRYVLLVGDTPDFGARTTSQLIPEKLVPCFYLPGKVTSRFGSTPTFPSDLPYGDLDADGEADAAVGRLPVRTPEELERIVSRIIAYETSKDFGLWRRRLQLTAGIGGFGAIVDTAIESVTRSVLTSALPNDVKPQIAYASPGHPFCPPDAIFAEAVMRRYQNGARFWIYAGHGSIDRLDLLERASDDSSALAARTDANRTRTETQSARWQVTSLLSNDSVSQLKPTRQPSPIAVLMACYTGAFDAPGDCLAERMLQTPGGPVAVIAASRLSMPYGNARFGLALLEHVYATDDASSGSVPRLGDAMLFAAKSLQAETNRNVDGGPPRTPNQDVSATQMLVDSVAMFISPSGSDLEQERIEHAGLYHLLGDPTLRLHSPQSVQIEASTIPPDNDETQASIRVQLTSPVSGKLSLGLDAPLTGSTNSNTDAIMPDDPHASSLAEATSIVEAGVATDVQLRLPAGYSGMVTVRAFVGGDVSWATGSARLFISQKRK